MTPQRWKPSDQLDSLMRDKCPRTDVEAIASEVAQAHAAGRVKRPDGAFRAWCMTAEHKRTHPRPTPGSPDPATPAGGLDAAQRGLPPREGQQTKGYFGQPLVFWNGQWRSPDMAEFLGWKRGAA